MFEILLTRTNVYVRFRIERGMYMKKIIEEYLGVIFLYSVVIFGIFILNARFKYLNETEIKNQNVAVGGLYE